MEEDIFWSYVKTRPTYEIKKTEYPIVKTFLRFLKNYGFERNKKGDYYLGEYWVGLSNANLMFYKKPINEQQKVKDITFSNKKLISITLDTHLQITAYDLSYYIANDSKNIKEFLNNILINMESDIRKELKHIVRQNRINKILI